VTERRISRRPIIVTTRRCKAIAVVVVVVVAVVVGCRHGFCVHRFVVPSRLSPLTSILDFWYNEKSIVTNQSDGFNALVSPAYRRDVRRRVNTMWRGAISGNA